MIVLHSKLTQTPENLYFYEELKTCRQDKLLIRITHSLINLTQSVSETKKNITWSVFCPERAIVAHIFQMAHPLVGPAGMPVFSLNK